MLGRVLAQKSFRDKSLDLLISNDCFLLKVIRLVDQAPFDRFWPRLYGQTGNQIP
jgi:hypothetical protein